MKRDRAMFLAGSRSKRLGAVTLRLTLPPNCGKKLVCKEGEKMANLDWSQCPAVESMPGKVSGAWVLRGTRMPVMAIFENLHAIGHQIGAVSAFLQ